MAQDGDMILEGLKVVDAASFLAGPCAATIMSDYGADVIKIEPLTGDRHRTISGGHPIDHSWQLTGRNKRSLALNIAVEAGRDVLLKLVADADVLVVNFRPDQLAKYRLTFEELHAHNPRLVVAQVSGYGNDGADAGQPAFDMTGWWARTGILDMVHDKGVAPAPGAGGVGDHATAMTLFGAIMLALYRRDKTGEGSFVHTSLATAGAWANGLNLHAVMTGVDIAARRDIEGWSNPFSNVYETRDGRYLLLSVQNMKRDWPKLAAALGHSEWLEDERFATVRTLFRNRREAGECIAAGFMDLDLADALARLLDAGIVHSVIARNAEVVEDQQLIDNGLIVPTDETEPGYDRALATPIRIDGVSQRTPSRAPTIGQHSAEILAEHGYDAAAAAELTAAGVVGQVADGSV
ncbi:MAG: CoA transferase [Pseudomonadota bacterium]